MRFVKVYAVDLYSSTDTTTVGKKLHFILSEIKTFHMIDNLSVAVRILNMCMLTSLSVDEIILLRYVTWSTNFRGLPF